VGGKPMLAAGRTANPLKPARPDNIFPVARINNSVDPDAGGVFQRWLVDFLLKRVPTPKNNLELALHT